MENVCTKGVILMASQREAGLTKQQKEILQLIREEPGISRRIIKRIIDDGTTSLIHYHTKILLNKGFIREIGGGNNVTLWEVEESALDINKLWV